MRLSEVKGDRAFEILPEIIGAVAPIADDPAAAEMIRPITLPEGTSWERYKLVWLAEISEKVVKPHKKQHANASGQLKKGTSVTCKATKTVGSDIWMQIPSGWVAAYYNGKQYVA